MKTSLLTSGYGKNEVLHKVDFAAGKGLTAIIGANGSGKSTLLKSICGLCDKFSGKITWNDRGHYKHSHIQDCKTWKYRTWPRGRTCFPN